ncbi:unnamed protein product [Lepeophtheirus salmonis]|uniref:(salmon louse) hypothetical protein n=1 Tax=Lepeophtheirus salmonis TaxID=72036 RepID=A0A7R8CYL1_LEPSM|nr:unnamed protein product [Lepeophtheirus salmonis]CAF2970267.1 unnamed protein product [Lepeophtheirus salmonis]
MNENITLVCGPRCEMCLAPLCLDHEILEELEFSRKATHEELQEFINGPQYFVPHHRRISFNDCLLNGQRLQPNQLVKVWLAWKFQEFVWHIGEKAILKYLSEEQKIKANDFVFSGFMEHQDCLPSTICNSCRFFLKDGSTELVKRLVPICKDVNSDIQVIVKIQFSSRAIQGLQRLGNEALVFIVVLPYPVETYKEVHTLISALSLSYLDLISSMDLNLCNMVLGFSLAVPSMLAKSELVMKFKERGSVLSKAKDFKNCVHEPLFDLPSDTLTEDVLVLRELYLLLGAGNKLLDALNMA